jgi:hypothetical protein
VSPCRLFVSEREHNESPEGQARLYWCRVIRNDGEAFGSEMVKFRENELARWSEWDRLADPSRGLDRLELLADRLESLKTRVDGA